MFAGQEAESIDNNHDSGFNNCTCLVCGVKFHDKPSHIKKGGGKYCSKKCHYEAKKEYMKGEKNHQFGLKGRKNASWKSDVRITSYGYRAIRDLGHPFQCDRDFVFEHRLVAEKYLLTDENSIEIDGKRYLSPDYAVHHKNFDRLDNRVENLEVMLKSEHHRLHALLNPQKKDKKNGRFIMSDKIKIKRVTETAVIPTKGTVDSAGYDLYADIEDKITIKPNQTIMFPTNIAFAIPKGYFGAVFARSGLASKHGIRPATCVSVIDSDYRGAVGVPLHNDSKEPFDIYPQDRIAQIVFMPAKSFYFDDVEELDDTERGESGYGSTGK